MNKIQCSCCSKKADNFDNMFICDGCGKEICESCGNQLIQGSIDEVYCNICYPLAKPVRFVDSPSGSTLVAIRIINYVAVYVYGCWDSETKSDEFKHFELEADGKRLNCDPFCKLPMDDEIAKVLDDLGIRKDKGRLLTVDEAIRDIATALEGAEGETIAKIYNKVCDGFATYDGDSILSIIEQ